MFCFIKSTIAFVATMLIATGAVAGPTGKGSKPGAGAKPSEIVRDLEKDFRSLGIADAKTGGLEALIEARPDLRVLVESVRDRLKSEAAIASFKINKDVFTVFIQKMNAASAQAAEVLANGAPQVGSTQAKVIEIIEALPSVLAEVATGGPGADVQKATDVATIVANTSNNMFKPENAGTLADVSLGVLKGTAEQPANLTDVIILINQRLGSDKNGKKLTIDDLIKRCLQGMRKA